MAFSVPFLAETALRAKTGFAQQARQRELEDAEQARQDAIQRRLQDQLLLQQREAEAEAADRRSLVPLRQRLLEAQAKDAEAQAGGTGRYAPKPERPRRTFKTNADGRVVAIDDDTLAVTPIPGVRERVPSAGGGEGGPGWQLARTADGKDVRVNVRTGEIRPLEATLAGPANRPLTGDERKGAAYLTRAETSMKELDRVIGSGYQPSVKLELLGSTARSSPQGKGVLGSLVGSAVSGVANAALGGEDQQFLQAAQNIVNAINRRDSGANITAAEWSDAFQRYLPRYSDDPITREQKRRALAAEIEGLRFSAGRAMGTSQPGQGATAEPTPAPATKRSALSDLNYLRGKP